MDGFLEAQDCTWAAGLAWLEQQYPTDRFEFGCSIGTGNSWVKINGSLALKEERLSQLGAKLCNEFASQWEEMNAGASLPKPDTCHACLSTGGVWYQVCDTCMTRLNALEIENQQLRAELAAAKQQD